MANPIHHSRFLRYRGGVSTADIAKQDGVSEKTVLASVRSVEVYEHLYSAPRLEAAQIQTVLQCEELEREALRCALQAELVIRDPNNFEKIDSEPDIETRLAAVDRLTRKAEAVFGRHKPAPGGVNVAVGVNVGSNAATQGKSFEERLRSINARRREQAPSPRPELTAGDVIDVQDDADSSA